MGRLAEVGGLSDVGESSDMSALPMTPATMSPSTRATDTTGEAANGAGAMVAGLFHQWRQFGTKLLNAGIFPIRNRLLGLQVVIVPKESAAGVKLLKLLVSIVSAIAVRVAGRRCLPVFYLQVIQLFPKELLYLFRS
jgi:hypothetical protein